MELKVKDEYKEKVIAHHDTGAPLGKQTQPQLLQVAVMARQSGSPLLLDLFEELPSLAELMGEKTTSEIEQAKGTDPKQEKKTTK